MSELETALRQLAKNGELCYLSVVPVAGKGENGIIFTAQVSPASRFGHSEGRDAGPVKALLAAIDGLPKSFVKEKSKPKRTVIPPPRYDHAMVEEPWDLV
jgi:hypothetical protein